MKKLLLLLLVPFLMVAQTTTHIHDVLLNPTDTVASGSTVSGTLKLTSNSWDVNGRKVVKTVAPITITAGVVDIDLAPNDTDTNTNSYYIAEYSIKSKNTTTNYSEKWQVPTSDTDKTINDITVNTTQNPAINPVLVSQLVAGADGTCAVSSGGKVSWTTCGTGGGSSPGGTDGQIQYRVNSTTFGGFTPKVNSVNITTPSGLNFLDSSATNGLTYHFTNPSLGQIQFSVTGTLDNAGLTHDNFAVTYPSWLTGPSVVSLGGTLGISPSSGQTPGRVLGTCGSGVSVSLCALVASDIPALNYQTPLGYTAENVTNKDTTVTLGTSNTLYPSQNAVKTYVDNGLSGKQNSLGYIPLNTANNLSELTATAATARTNLGLGTAATHPSTDFEVPLTFGTGLNRTVNTIIIPNAGVSNAMLANSTLTFVLPSWLTGDGPTALGGTFTVTPTTGQTSHRFIGTCNAATTFAPCAIVPGDIPTLNQNTTGTAGNITGITADSTFTQGNGTGGVQSSGKAVPSGAVVGTTDTQALTNKTIDGVTPTTMGFVDPTSSIQTQLNGKQASLGFTPENVSNKDAVSGYAGLDGSGLLKATEFPAPSATTFGGVQSKTCTNQVMASLSTLGVFSCVTITSSMTSGLFSPTAHNLLSSSHGDTTAASAVRGDGIFAVGATPTWQRVAHPPTGGYFKWNGTDVVASTGAAGGTGTCSSHQFQTGDNADAAPTCAQPAFTDINGTAAATQIPTNNRAGGFSVVFKGADATTPGSIIILTVPYACTITDWVITVDSGTATVKLWRVADGGTAIPNSGNNINTGGVGFQISANTRIHSTNISDLGTNTTLSAYDTIAVNLFATTATSQVGFTLGCTK